MNDDVPGLAIWVVYDHPKDYPNNYVAREWRGEAATGNYMVCPDLELLRGELINMGLVKLMPMDGDDPVILETWL
jgi:hypothetical protein